MTTYLKFQDEAQVIDQMPYAFDAEQPTPAGMTIDLIGTIHKPTGLTLTSEDGMAYPEMAAIPGYHVNVAGSLPDELLPFVVVPANPTRVFGGTPTLAECEQFCAGVIA